VSKHVYARYISGPMRGVPEHNYPTFMAVEESLCQGFPDHRVLNPARNFEGDKTFSVIEYMEQDLRQVIEADEIVLLPGWETSEGARREIELGKWLSKNFTLAHPLLVDGNPTGEWRFEFLNEAPTLDDSARASALDEAKQLITGDRNNQYGPPNQDFERTAGMCNAFGFQVNGQPLRGHHVAIFMMLLKTSRLAWTPAKRDSWVDNAGYAGCGYECATIEAEEDKAAQADDVHAEMTRISDDMAREFATGYDAETARKFFASVLFGDGECEE
jgi:hypothetical protein